jgi:Na+/melibiose symporter-like transporter
MGAMIAYAVITNTVLMTIYSMNNMPYAALGGVMTGDVHERASLNTYRFIAVNAAQFLVVGFTLPLRDKFAGPEHDLQHGWRMVMMIWAVICLVFFIITFATTRERIKPVTKEKSSPKRDFADLLKNGPWKIMFLWTLVHFAILTFRGGAQYNYFFHYADKAAMFDWLSHFGLVAPLLGPGEVPTGFVDKWLGYIVHGDRTNLANSNVASVCFSIVFMLNMATTLVVILLSPPLAKKFGKKAVCATAFALATVGWLAFYFLAPTNTWGMVAITAFVSVVYAPTIPLTWAIFADVADYSEWKTGRRFTGMVFATIMFGLKSGLALGSAAFLMIMAGLFHYDTHGTPEFALGDANTIASISNASSLGGKINVAADPVSAYVKAHLSSEAITALAADNASGSSATESTLVRDLNKILTDPSLFDTNRFANVKLRMDTQELLEKRSRTQYELQCLNRLLLEDAYSSEISRQHNQPTESKHGFRFCVSILTGILFAICTVLLFSLPLNKQTTLQMADELAERRKRLGAQPSAA